MNPFTCFFNRRTDFNPLWNTVVVAGFKNNKRFANQHFSFYFQIYFSCFSVMADVITIS